MATRSSVRRAVVVGGVRTPFVKAFGPFMEMDTIALGGEATRALIERTNLGARMITTMANELVERDGELALLGICAAGGLGASGVLERV